MINVRKMWNKMQEAAEVLRAAGIRPDLQTDLREMANGYEHVFQIGWDEPDESDEDGQRFGMFGMETSDRQDTIKQYKLYRCIIWNRKTGGYDSPKYVLATDEENAFGQAVCGHPAWSQITPDQEAWAWGIAESSITRVRARVRGYGKDQI